jgi:hypothetical protein
VTDKLMAAQHNQHPVSCDGGFRACNVFVLQVKRKESKANEQKRTSNDGSFFCAQEMA